MDHEPNRRSIFAWAIFGLGAIFSAIIGVPILCYAIDPRHRKGPKSNFKLIEGVKLDELIHNTPVQGVIRDRRVDGWTLYPSDVIGRVWVVEFCARPEMNTPDQVREFNESNRTDKEKFLIVFTTICPHLGCSVNLNNAGNGFACPCHAATFNLNGERATEANPALRPMDTLEWEIDLDDPDYNRIKVKYENFATSIKEKKTSV